LQNFWLSLPAVVVAVCCKVARVVTYCLFAFVTTGCKCCSLYVMCCAAAVYCNIALSSHPFAFVTACCVSASMPLHLASHLFSCFFTIIDIELDRAAWPSTVHC